eukprot:GEMP01049218.1.p1 GENE.GEMP01049218.1~~GEMP01049218.1.p1  ORF type:complete len:321 (+),score=92.82 GEMP01049218.1:66-1028(+)
MLFRSLIVGFFALAAAKKKKGKKACEGIYDKEGDVKNLCRHTFPKEDSDKVWLIQFYTPYGKTKTFQSSYEELATELKDNTQISVGAIDCSKGANVAFCREKPYNVKDFPQFASLHKGKVNRFRRKMEKEALKTFIEVFQEKVGSKGGSAKCPKGMFTSTLKDPVVPLCTEHFPNEKSKNSWVVVFYSEDFDSKVITRVSLDLGNEPVDKSKQLKKYMAQRKRLKNLKDKYELPIAVPKKGELGGMEPLAKVGAVCCHCDEGKYKAFCEEKVGSGAFEGQKYVFTDGSNNVALEGGSSADELISQILAQLGHIEVKEKEL